MDGSHKSAVSEVTGLKFKSPGGGTSILGRSVLGEDVMEKVGGWLAPRSGRKEAPEGVQGLTGSISVCRQAEPLSTLTVLASNPWIPWQGMDDIAQAKSKSKEQRVRAFCNAAAAGNMDMLQRLHSSGIHVDSTDSNGRTALMLATCGGHMAMVEWLVSQGAKLNLRDKFGGSALGDAMAGNHTEIMAYLKQVTPAPSLT